MYYTHRKIHAQLQRSETILIVTHQNPDGDALGSASAMAEYLKQQNKKSLIFCLNSAPNNLKFLPHIHLLNNDREMLASRRFDVLLALDTGDLRYAGIASQITKQAGAIINIDHHSTNENFGHINLVDEKASSVAEILYNFFKCNNIKLNRNLATALLTGLMTDTSNFTNAATTAIAVNIAGNLLRLGANLSLINKWINRNATINQLKLWGVVFDRLRVLEKINMAYTYLTKQDYAKFAINDQETLDIANFLNSISDVKMTLFLKEIDNNKIKGSFRSTYDGVDVSALAKTLGGGGHKKAAGFTFDGTIAEALEKILTIA